MAAQERCNIVFIVIDTHRRDRLGMYGYPRPTSPNLDAFAAGATLFENAISPAQWTIPAHASMFTGEYPSTHLTTQAGHSLDPYFDTLASWLGRNGYQNIGFCNNPLVGVLSNNLKRGFETFYNYGGAIPSTPARDARGLLKPLSKVWERYTQLLRKISYPIQNVFAKSDRFFQLSLNPLFVPLWTSFANFKGDTQRSIQDSSFYIRTQMSPRLRANGREPHFVFINLMETHLPFTPPEPFGTRFAPYFNGERAARDFLRVYNTLALRWLLPMGEPFSELEARTLSDFYDAEVAYQDHLLEELLTELDHPFHRQNTMVILVADHGEMLGEHDLMGHGFRVYQELVHVPLVIRYPGQTIGSRVKEPVSTMQLFHTILDQAQVPVQPANEPQGEESMADRVERLSLRQFASEPSFKPQSVFSEAYAPMNVLKIMAKHAPDLIDRFSSRSTFRAAFDPNGYKLIRATGLEDAFYNLKRDASESFPIPDSALGLPARQLGVALDRFLETTRARRPELWSRAGVDLDDELLSQRLRALGYID